jgi:hypothetical protein
LTMRAGLASIVLLLSTGCFNPFGGRDVPLDIESIEAPESITSQEPLPVTVTVVTGGCLSFDRFIVTRETQRITIEAWGEDSSRGLTACTTDIRFEPKTYVVERPLSDPFTVIATKRDGTTLERVVRIR